ncbi:MAG: prolyl oligopeptidase family serine peptidase [Actinomycetes bacterium]
MPASTRVFRYPEARRLDLVDELHGHKVADPYRWLEDAASAETQAWVDAQDRLLRGYLDELPGRDHLRTRLTQLLSAGLVTAPAWRRERCFFMRRTSEQEHAVLLTIDPDGGERVLLDPVAIDPAGTTTVDAWQPDKEGRLLAYQISSGGTEESTLHVIDVESGDPVEAPIDRTRYSPVAWLPGGEHYYYVRRMPPDQLPEDEQQFHRRVWLHEVGGDPETDVEIFGAGLDMTNYYGVTVSMNGRWLIVAASAGTAPRDDVWIADLSASSLDRPTFTVVQEGVDAQTAAHVGRDDRLYLLTDRDASRGRLCVTSPEAPGYENWKDLVAEDSEAVLDNFAILDGAELETPTLLAGWTRHAITEVTVHDLADGKRRGQLELPGLGTLTGLGERPEGGSESWFTYTDYLTPPTAYHYDARTDVVDVWAHPPGSVDVPAVHARQVVYRSVDDTPVRLTLLSREREPSEPKPTILYGYGGFGVSMTPAYAATALAWVEAGGVYAIANIRGGSEEGEDWHRAGMRERKQNVFDDFHAAAEWLIDQGWTTHQQLGISGGSNGGLLVGAALTQRPDLYAAVTCAAPLLDMVRYEGFGLGTTWNDEYGKAEDATEFEWLIGYSPYHRVVDGVDYPAVLFTVFDSDTRVEPLHARKMCAALQHSTVSDRPVMIRTERDVGHGARAVSRTVELSVDMMTFVAAQTGLTLTDD